jgi:hypothetical protein
MYHKLLNGSNLTVGKGRRKATLKGRPAGSGNILSSVYSDHIFFTWNSNERWNRRKGHHIV